MQQKTSLTPLPQYCVKSRAHKAPRRKQRGINFALQAAGFSQPTPQGAENLLEEIKDMAAGATFISIVIWYAVLGVVLYELLVGTELFSGVVRP